MSFEEAVEESRKDSTQVFQFDVPVTVLVTEHYVIINPGHCHALRIGIRELDEYELPSMYVDDWWGWGS